jgi:hypothetical protein
VGERRDEGVPIIGEDHGVATSTRDGDIGESRVYQFLMDIRVDVDENALGGKSLGTVRGNGVAVICAGSA